MTPLACLMRAGLPAFALLTPGLVGIAPAAADPGPKPSQNEATGQDAAPGPDGKEAGASDAVVRWLEKLEQRGRTIRSLQASLVYQKYNRLLGDRQTRTGMLLYHDAEPGLKQRDPRFAVRFKQLIVNNARRDRRVDYIFDGTWLVEKNHERNLFLKRQVVPPGEQLDPLQIDGPFPVPIGQRREEVLRRFRVEAVEPPKQGERPFPELDKPALHLRLTPREDAPETAGRKRLKRIDMWFNRDTLLPLKVTTVNSSEVETTVRLSNIRVNELGEEALAERFDTSQPGEGWRVEITPWQDAKKQ